MQTLPEQSPQPAPLAARTAAGPPDTAEDEPGRVYLVPEVRELPPAPRVEAPDDVEW